MGTRSQDECAWVKSSFSGNVTENCLEVRRDSLGSTLIRESESPDAVLRLPHDRLCLLLAAAKRGELDSLVG